MADSLPEAADVPTIGPGRHGPMETGWHEGVTGPYMTALSRLRDEVNRELDAVQVGQQSRESLLAALDVAQATRVRYYAHVLDHLEQQ